VLGCTSFIWIFYLDSFIYLFIYLFIYYLFIIYLFFVLLFIHLFIYCRVGFHMPSLRPVSMGPGVVFHPLEAPPQGFDLASPQGGGRDANVSLESELSNLDTPEKHARETSGMMDKEQVTDAVSCTEKSTGTSEWRQNVASPLCMQMCFHL
jgi:hypothetical protein